MKIQLVIIYLLLSQQLLFGQETLEQKINSLSSSYLNGKSGSLIIGIRKGGQNKVYYLGETKSGTNQLPDNNSIFELGELTEILTTALYTELAFDGSIDADDPLQKYLPEYAESPVYLKIICEPAGRSSHFDKDGGSGINIAPNVCRPDPMSTPQPLLLCYLANHTSGLPEMPDNIKRKSKDPLLNYSADNLYAFLNSYQIINKQENSYRHSMMGIGLLAHVLELKSGKNYNALFDEKIARPLGLTSSFINSPEDDRKLLVGHSKNGKEVPHLHYGVISGAKGLCSNITDIMKVLEVNMLTENSHMADVFSFNQKPRIKTCNDCEVALGWNIKTTAANNKLIWQHGKTNGFASYMGFYKEKGYGIVILSSVSKDVQSLGEAILEKMMSP
jgi:serine-type D-Ala-D-Ala carboxypeptidase/endopeptidase